MTHRHKPAISVTASSCMCSGAWECVCVREISGKKLNLILGLQNTRKTEMMKCNCAASPPRRFGKDSIGVSIFGTYTLGKDARAWNITTMQSMKNHTNGYTHKHKRMYEHTKQKQQARNRAEGNKSVKRKKGGRTKEWKKGFFCSVGCQQRLLQFLSICFLPFLSSCFYLFSLLRCLLLIALSLKNDSSSSLFLSFVSLLPETGN